MHSELPRILVGVDFSPSSDRAIAEGERLAAQMGAQIDFVHIAPASERTAGLDTSAVEKARATLEELERASRCDGYVAKMHLGVGDPITGLLDFVHRLKPALVVVGSHGRGAVLRLLVGSVAENLIRHAHVPVLVVPAADSGAQLAAAG